MTSWPEVLPAIVLDSGSGQIKAGFAGDDASSVVFPSIIGQPKLGGAEETGSQNRKIYVGTKPYTTEDMTTWRYPVKHGIVTNWDDLEQLWAHCFQELRADPQEHGILISDPPLNPRANRERTMELIFEGFNASATFLANSGQLNLYACGRHTGIMADIGHGMMSTVPFYESFCFTDAIQRQDFGGQDLTFYLQRLLHEKGYSFTSMTELQLVQDMKEALGYVNSNDQAVTISKSSLEKSYTLPDGNIITLDKERFMCPEALFNPSLAGFSCLKSLPDLIHSSLMMCDVDVRKHMYVGFLVSGGCSLFPGFLDRLKFELLKKLSPNVRVYVRANEPRKYAAWIGGSILASLSTFQHRWISKLDYNEHGPSLISRCYGSA